MSGITNQSASHLQYLTALPVVEDASKKNPVARTQIPGGHLTQSYDEASSSQNELTQRTQAAFNSINTIAQQDDNAARALLNFAAFNLHGNLPTNGFAAAPAAAQAAASALPLSLNQAAASCAKAIAPHVGAGAEAAVAKRQKPMFPLTTDAQAVNLREIWLRLKASPLENLNNSISLAAGSHLRSFSELEQLQIVKEVDLWNRQSPIGKNGLPFNLSARVVHVCQEKLRKFPHLNK